MDRAALRQSRMSLGNFSLSILPSKLRSDAGSMSWSADVYIGSKCSMCLEPGRV